MSDDERDQSEKRGAHSGDPSEEGSASAQDAARSRELVEADARDPHDGGAEKLRPGEKGYVGYRYPPEEHQFKTGHKSTGGRRPQKAKTPDDVWAEILGQEVKIKGEGTESRSSLYAFICRLVAQQAVKGDLKAIKEVLKRGDKIGKVGFREMTDKEYTQHLYDSITDEELKLLDQLEEEMGWPPHKLNSNE